MVGITKTSAGLKVGMVLAMCLGAGSAMADFQTLNGSVLYREKIALPPEALVEVTLEDVSKMDVKSTVLARQTLKPSGQVPVAYQLTYDDGMVDERGRYSVRAVIRVGDNVMWRSTQSFAALTEDAPETVDVVVEKMVQRAENALSGSDWVVVQMNGNTVQEARVPELKFAPDGRVSGTSGCNRFTGNYTEKGSQLEFGPLATTRMACPGDLGQQETTFFQTLAKVTAYGVRDGQKVLLDTSGAVVMQLLAE
ncbi:META domain-containing protein [Shimia sagamensis]|nr:META domain-containing protein [Shimia sagamensis]